MKIGLTYDLREDYGIERNSEIYADFCNPGEIGYIAEAILRNGYEVELIGNMYRLNERIRQGAFDCDLVFVEDEGLASRNREAIVPALLELNGIPYVGSDAYAMGLTQNKYHTKLIASALGIRVPEGLYLPCGRSWKQEDLKRMMEERRLDFPLIVKPNAEGYSMGVFLVRNLEQMEEAVRFDMANYHQEVIAEPYIRGPELYVPLVGSGERSYALGVGMCSYEDGSQIDVFSLTDKCFGKIVDQVAPLPVQTAGMLEEWSLKLYRHLDCKDFGRVDFKLDGEGTPYFLEINPRPGLTEKGPYETCAAGAGKSYDAIIGEIIDSARARWSI